MTITQYLGTGTISRGRMSILPNMNTRVSVAPYLRDQHDKEAVIQGIEYIRGVLSNIQNLTWITPTANQSTTAFVNLVSSSYLLCWNLLWAMLHSPTLLKFPGRSHQQQAHEAQIIGRDHVLLVLMMAVLAAELSLILTREYTELITFLSLTPLYSQEWLRGIHRDQ